jgi:hypothetical protein
MASRSGRAVDAAAARRQTVATASTHSAASVSNATSPGNLSVSAPPLSPADVAPTTNATIPQNPSRQRTTSSEFCS